MDWQRLLALGALLSTLGACGGAGLSGQPLAAGQAATQPAVSLQVTKVVAKHALAYRVAIDRPYLASVELRTEFELVVRSIPGEGKTRAPRRARLGDALYDISDLVLDSKGKRAYVASLAGWVRSYDLESLVMKSEWRTGSAATALALSDDRKYLLVGTESGLICLRRLRDGAQLQCMVAHEDRIASLATHQGRLASATWQGEVSLWDLPALKKLGMLPPNASVADLAISPDGRMLAVTRNRRPPVRTQAISDAEATRTKLDAVGENRIEIHQLSATGIEINPIHKLVGHHATVSSLSWIGTDLLSGSWDRSVLLWNTISGSRTAHIGDFRHIVRDLASLEIGAAFAVASWALKTADPAISWGLLRYSPSESSDE